MSGDPAMHGLFRVIQPPPPTHQQNNSHNIPQTEKYYKQELRESHFMAETLVLFSLTVSAIITQNGMKTPPAEFGSLL
jgi:hypothetical protein